jgi:hypothetical protein
MLGAPFEYDNVFGILSVCMDLYVCAVFRSLDSFGQCLVNVNI